MKLTLLTDQLLHILTIRQNTNFLHLNIVAGLLFEFCVESVNSVNISIEINMQENKKNCQSDGEYIYQV